MQHWLRLGSGLVLAAFVVCHLLNHAAGVVSLEAAEAYRALAHRAWSSLPGGVLLYGALGLHFALALVSLYRRRTLRMPAWEALQLGLGLAFVPLVAKHAVATRGAQELLGLAHEYAQITYFIWASPVETAKQVTLVGVGWLHAALGIHYWLRLKPAYRRLQPVLLPAYTLVPVLALIGFYRSGVEVGELGPDGVTALLARIPLQDYARFTNEVTGAVLATAAGLVLAAIAARAARAVGLLGASGRANYTIDHPSGALPARVGQTVLEALRAAGVPHASVCGGRARCTTCRVRIGAGLERLPPPADLERTALERIAADPSVRLACQTRPRQRLAITPLVPPSAGAERAGRHGGVAGNERVITVLFVDLRGSTRLGQRRLPYDVLFVLNQFFAEMSQALAETRGHYAQFNGDGLMAIYGAPGAGGTGEATSGPSSRGQRAAGPADVPGAARAALAGAIAMLRRLEALNHRLGGELEEPLRIGIGIHTGEAIVGTMGPPSSPIYSAIGDNVNVAARLEALTKELDCLAVVSAATAARTGLDFSAFDTAEVAIRGRSGSLAVHPIRDAGALASLLAEPIERVDPSREAGAETRSPAA